MYDSANGDGGRFNGSVPSLHAAAAGAESVDAIDAGGAHRIVGTGARGAVLDSGVQGSHPERAGSVVAQDAAGIGAATGSTANLRR